MYILWSTKHQLFLFFTLIGITIFHFFYQEAHLSTLDESDDHEFAPISLTAPISLIMNYRINSNERNKFETTYKGTNLLPVEDWGAKYDPIRVWCCIKTLFNKDQLLIIQQTWGKYCDKLLFIVGDNQQNEIEEVNIAYDDGTILSNIIRLKLNHTGFNLTNPTKDLWEKVWKSCKYLYKYHRNEFEWIVMADTDTWLSAYNFKGYAQYFDPTQSWYMGHTVTSSWLYKNCAFNAGGSYALSIGSITKLNKIFDTSEFLNRPFSPYLCTAWGAWADDVHLAICLKSVGIFAINSLDRLYRARFSVYTYHSLIKEKVDRRKGWYWKNRFEGTGRGKNCCAIHPIAFHYYKDIKRRKQYFMHLDEMFTEKSKDSWFNHEVPQIPTTFLFNTSFTAIDEYFNVKRPPKGQKIWKGVDNLWNYTA